VARIKLTTPLFLALAPFALGASEALADEAGPAAAPQLEVSLIGAGLRTNDLDAAIRFWRDGLGLVEITRLEPGELIEVIMGFGTTVGPPMLLLLARRDGVPEDLVPAERRKDKLVLSVSDTEAARAQLAAAGYAPGEIHVHEPSGTHIFWVNDPDGHRLEITQPPIRAQ
jgi:catechol 2,3-dioxygenase-like lactoylglutathione lyase family enzyme